MEWAGKVVFYERWDQDNANDNPEETELQAEMQGMELKSRGAHNDRRQSGGVHPAGSLIPGTWFYRIFQNGISSMTSLGRLWKR